MIYLASLSETTADKVNGYQILHTLDEVHGLIARNKEANKLIIRNDFASAYFTPTGLTEFMHDIKQLNRNLLVELEDKRDGMLPATFKNKIKQARTPDEMRILMAKYPVEFMDTVKDLVQKEFKRSDELLSASATVSQLHSVIDSLKKENDNLAYQLEIEQMNKAQYQSRLDSLVNRINYQYGKHIDKDKLFRVDSNSYDKIIYIKEISRVQYTDSLVYYLGEILKILYSMPARRLVVEGFYAHGKTNLYPRYAPYYACTENDVLSGDIMMLGMQPNMMRDILKNPSRVSILIVLDRSGYSIPYIEGDNVEYFYTASDKNDVPINIPDDRIISYMDEDNSLFIPYFNGFDELDMNEKITAYSTSTIIKRIVDLIERG